VTIHRLGTILSAWIRRTISRTPGRRRVRPANLSRRPRHLNDSGHRRSSVPTANIRGSIISVIRPRLPSLPPRVSAIFISQASLAAHGASARAHDGSSLDRNWQSWRGTFFEYPYIRRGSWVIGCRLPRDRRMTSSCQRERRFVMRPDFFVHMGDVSPSSLACPKCRNVEGRVLPFSERLGVQRWFLRCAVCGHVWTIDKKLQTPGQSQTK